MISGSSKSRKLAMVMTGLVLGAGAAHVSANETVALKHALYGAGYEIRNVNAAMDAATRAALEAFQSDHPNLQATGTLNDDTKKALGLVSVEISASQASAPLAARADTVQAPQEESVAVQEEDGIQEDDDGGWSFF